MYQHFVELHASPSLWLPIIYISGCVVITELSAYHISVPTSQLFFTTSLPFYIAPLSSVSQPVYLCTHHPLTASSLETLHPLLFGQLLCLYTHFIMTFILPYLGLYFADWCPFVRINEKTEFEPLENVTYYMIYIHTAHPLPF